MQVVEKKLQRREVNSAVYSRAVDFGLSPLLARIVASRVDGQDEVRHFISPSLRLIPSPDKLTDAEYSAERIARAIIDGEVIGIVTDYDVDGVCSHVIILESFVEHFGVDPSRIQSHVGHRIRDGYGVSGNLVQRISVQPERPTLIITADCGSSDEEGIAKLSRFSDVIVSDHHIVPKSGPPESAYATVNPSRKDCLYPDKTIAGCMVAWLLMSQVRKVLVEQSLIPQTAPKLSSLLDMVSLGTVADCVSIATTTNRAVVKAGLDLMNRRTRPCWQAVDQLLGMRGRAFDEQVLAFQIGPRVNARSRMADAYAALYFLLARSRQDAEHWLAVLDSDNKSRRETERAMLQEALTTAEEQVARGANGIVVYVPNGHIGVQGIVASRLLEQFGRPVMVFTDSAEDGYLQGSGRSISDVHLRDVLDHVDGQVPGCLKKYGGHRAAVGATIWKESLSEFTKGFMDGVKRSIGDRQLWPVILTDGELKQHEISLSAVRSLDSLAPFGREFDPPQFDNVFSVREARLVGQPALHTLLRLEYSGIELKGIWFNSTGVDEAECPVRSGDRIRCVYQLAVDDYNGSEDVQLLIRHAMVVAHSDGR